MVEQKYSVMDREHMGGGLTLSDTAAISRGVSIDTSADVTIGDGVVISDDVLILTHDHVPENISMKYASSLTIGDGAWIGARSIILASCMSIGRNSVIGAGSVVTHNVPPDELWAGNPAKMIRVIRNR